jgi:hypothetical protein
MISQSGCALTQITCESGAQSTSGSVNGAQYSYTGTAGDGSPTMCSGTVNGNTATGTCTTFGVPCDFAANRL